ncbi:glycosyltransferase family 25 protein [Melanomma pulvis-pyrius CBS 109.77]|uniref:Glycosyltransferase family 25 protein n=1 Tax=Melanomma pulvis-pyrius CBS 109.77 TaxID=1314802 RepID=A0A6A6XEV6_9PLEO|nr:glycosyltransferase family 25 protein [Melanomma pulvis-pyrius CBS 109.77]
MPDRLSNPSLPFSARAPEPKPANATLDFQEIIFLSMPYRTDRQDALSLIAAVTGLKLTMIPGVSADEIHPKAMPPHVGNNNMTGTAALGIWRAHANVWRYIIDNNIQSALIIEDDVDWDTNIKEIMGTLNWQLRYNNTIRWGKDNVQKGWKEECPYGCDWDELFVGHCGGKPNRNRLDLHQVIAEPHGPKIETIMPWAKKEMTTLWNLTESEGIRVIAPTWEPICLMGYGLSRMGAMRMLYQIGGWRPFGHPVDNEIAWRTSEGSLSGYTMMPPAFVSWRVGGSQDSDNDAGMNAQAVQSKGNMEGKSVGLKNSVRKSLEGFFEKNYWADMANEQR